MYHYLIKEMELNNSITTTIVFGFSLVELYNVIIY